MKITVNGNERESKKRWRMKIYCEGKGVATTKRIMLGKVRNKRRSEGREGKSERGQAREGRDKGRKRGGDE
jgi:hypothetical protein